MAAEDHLGDVGTERARRLVVLEQGELEVFQLEPLGLEQPEPCLLGLGRERRCRPHGQERPEHRLGFGRDHWVISSAASRISAAPRPSRGRPFGFG